VAIQFFPGEEREAEEVADYIEKAGGRRDNHDYINPSL
jgi:hypothetical protein